MPKDSGLRSLFLTGDFSVTVSGTGSRSAFSVSFRELIIAGGRVKFAEPLIELPPIRLTLYCVFQVTNCINRSVHQLKNTGTGSPDFDVDRADVFGIIHR